MASGFSGARVFATILTLSVAGPVFAQDDGRVWTVFVQDNPTRCWVTAQPTGTVATRGDQDVSGTISRDPAVFFVSFWPSEERLGEVSYNGGYPFAAGSTVSVVVGDTAIGMFSEGPNAWAGSPQDDALVLEAMRDGVEVVVTATSTRGTQVVDTFSLQGFGAAIGDAQARCSG